ncbi:MAG: hypothetical protein FWH42_02520 [Dehalococcoidia bacterium]|nr:hypothetical protein [Dehalococcoidia bacterium]
MNKGISKILAVIIVVSVALSGCSVRQAHTHYFSLPDAKISSWTVDNLYSELLPVIEPDNSELFISNSGIFCNLNTDGSITFMNVNIYAKKGADVYVYQLTKSYETGPNPSNEYKVSFVSKNKDQDSIFMSTVMLDWENILAGMELLPWDLIFSDYKVGSPSDYTFAVSYVNYWSPKNQRVFNVVKTGIVEVTPQEAPQNGYFLTVIPHYYIANSNGTSPDNVLSFVYTGSK